ncbi:MULTISPECIES: carboxypeptidase regulatory-like domain-containing protein [Pirellulaceae]|nr:MULTISPECIES: carboxypeptidase regulatory-like domain-containing protein [Pirellulaceae]
MKRTLLLAACLLLLIGGMGCSQQTENAVFGTVQYADGTPMAQGELIFDDGKYSDIAPIDSEGNFSVVKGLPAGTYKVTLGGVMEPDAKGNYSPIVHKRYLEYKSTDLNVTVPLGDEPVKFMIDRPKK